MRSGSIGLLAAAEEEDFSKEVVDSDFAKEELIAAAAAADLVYSSLSRWVDIIGIRFLAIVDPCLAYIAESLNDRVKLGYISPPDVLCAAARSERASL